MNGAKILLKLWIRTFLSIVGGCWLAIEIINTIFPGKVPMEGNPHYLLIPSLLISAIYIGWMTFCITCRVGDFDRTIVIRLGNILRQKDGTIVIGTNDELSTDLDLVGSDSLQTQVTKLIGQEAIEAHFNAFKRKYGASEDGKYPYGLCFEERAVRDKRVRLWASSKEPYSFLYIIMSSLTTGQNAYTTQAQLTQAIKQLFEKARELNIKKGTIYCPLLGTGAANVNLNKQTVAQILISQYIANCRISGCNIKKLVLYIHWRDLRHINLIELRGICEQMAAACSSCPEKNAEWF